MKQLLLEFRNEFIDRILEILWDQWTSLGIAGRGKVRTGSVIDPEALLLISCSIARYDARLFDAILEWLKINGRFVSVLRIKRMLKEEQFIGEGVLTALVAAASKRRRASMIVKGLIKKGEYFDSVSLMIVSRELSALNGVKDAAVVMGTQENKSILESAGLMLPEFAASADSELLISVKADSEDLAEAAMNKVGDLFQSLKQKKSDAAGYSPKSLDSAVVIMPDANLAIISVAGKYAGREARRALENGMHVMIFSDNVPLETEIELKKYGRNHGLLVMGPDCGTAIINGIPLAFANVVNRGDIGIVAAAGTGLQEVSSIISNEGAGISQAIGTGGRDVKEAVGGIMFLEAMKALNNDDDTKIMVLISKPPHERILQSIISLANGISKPIVAMFLGENIAAIKPANIIPASTLEEAALLATALSNNENPDLELNRIKERNGSIRREAAQMAKILKNGQRFVRGLFSGGTLAYEAQILLGKDFGPIWSNAPLKKEYLLKDAWKSFDHSIVDLGEDEFTIGRPHPMIDYSLRNRRILEEAADPEVAVILLDVVLGYGAHEAPEKELAPMISKAREAATGQNREVLFVCSITGTHKDPQNKDAVQKALAEAGAIMMPSNAAACAFTAGILSKPEPRTTDNLIE
jgi:FdrA protein